MRYKVNGSAKMTEKAWVRARSGSSRCGASPPGFGPSNGAGSAQAGWNGLTPHSSHSVGRFPGSQGMLAGMGFLAVSFWRAVVDCMRPRVIMLSMVPLLLIGILGGALGYFYWDSAVRGMRSLLESSTLLAPFWGWLHAWGVGDVTAVMAPLMVILVVTPVLVMGSLLAVALLMTPALVALVAQRRFPCLDRKRGGSFWAGVVWSLGSTLLAVIALVVSVPLWLVPPLVLVLPPLIWGWLTYRVMAFDALAEHASKDERREILRRHRTRLLGVGVLIGYLGAAPSLVWASAGVFSAAFFILAPLVIWIYTLVFAFSSLWFAHYCLAALERLRSEGRTQLPAAAPASDQVAVAMAVRLGAAPDDAFISEDKLP